MNGPALGAFRMAVGYLWRTVLRRRSQGNHLPWHRMRAPYCSVASACHVSVIPIPFVRLRRHHPRWEPDAVMPLVRICGGGHERSWSLRRLFFQTGIAVELAEQGVAIFLCPIGQVGDEVFNLVTGGIAKGLHAAKICRIGLD